MRFSAKKFGLELLAHDDETTIFEKVFYHLQNQDMAVQKNDEDDNVVWEFDDSIKNTKWGKFLLNNVLEPWRKVQGSPGISAINFFLNGKWHIVGFKNDLTADILAHERFEIRERKKMGLNNAQSLRTAHQQAKAKYPEEVTSDISEDMAQWLFGGESKISSGYKDGTKGEEVDDITYIRRLIENGSTLEEGIRQAENAIKNYPDNNDLVAILMWGYIKSKQGQKAVSLGDRIISEGKHTKEIKILNHIMIAYKIFDNLPKAIELGENMINENNFNAETINILMGAHIKNKDPQKAILLGEKFIELPTCKSDRYIINFLITAYTLVGDYAKAIALGEKNRSINKYIDTSLMQAYLKDGQPAKAVEVGEAMSEIIEGSDFVTRTVWAEAYIQNNQPQEAINVLDFSLFPELRTQAPVHNLLANAYRNLGQIKRHDEILLSARRIFSSYNFSIISPVSQMEPQRISSPVIVEDYRTNSGALAFSSKKERWKKMGMGMGKMVHDPRVDIPKAQPKKVNKGGNSGEKGRSNEQLLNDALSGDKLSLQKLQARADRGQQEAKRLLGTYRPKWGGAIRFEPSLDRTEGGIAFNEIDVQIKGQEGKFKFPKNRLADMSDLGSFIEGIGLGEINIKPLDNLNSFLLKETPY